MTAAERTATKAGHGAPLTGEAEGNGAPHAQSSSAPGLELALPLPDVSEQLALRRDTIRRRLLAVADVLALLLAYGAVLALSPPGIELVGFLALTATVPAWIVLNKVLGLYDRDSNVIHKSTLDELPRIVQSVVFGAALVFMIGPVVSGLDVGRGHTLLFIVGALVLTPACRTAMRAAFRHWSPSERCLILGSSSLAQELADKLAKHPEYGISLVGFIEEGSSESRREGKLRSLGGLQDFQRLCLELEVERVVMAFTALSPGDLLAALQASKQLGLKVSIVPGLYEALGEAVEVEQVEGMTLLGLKGLSRTGSSLLLKRWIDLALSSLGLIVLSPLLAAIALAIKLDSRGPVLFVQRRIGRHNQPFRIYKFRTMERDAEVRKDSVAHLNEAAEPMFKIADDPRLTRVGRRLRRFSLDEVPQLWNVLLGEMSLVGPRPLIPSEDDYVIGAHRARLDLTPGLTGPWQVLARRQVIPFGEMIKLDYLYVAEWSLWNDIKLLLRTAPVVIRGGGR